MPIRFACIALVLSLSLFVAGCGADRSASEQPAQPQAAQPPPAAEPAAAQPAGAETAAQPVTPAPARPERRTPSTRAAAPPGAEPAPAPKPKLVVLAAGTVVQVRTTAAISTKTAAAGDVFEASLAEPVMVGGREVFPKGAAVRGRVVDADAGGRVKGVATLALALTSIDGVPVATDTHTQEARSTTKKDAAKVGIGAGIGAAVGAIAGGGKGAAIGAAAGGGAGTAAVLATRGEAAMVPAESVLTFKLAQPATVK